MNEERADPPVDGRKPDFEAAKRYLLFVASGPGGTISSLVGTFADERLARLAFVNQRLHSATPGASARLLMADAAGRMRVICWFGPSDDLVAYDNPGSNKAASDCGVIPAKNEPGVKKMRVTALADGKPLDREADQHSNDQTCETLPLAMGDSRIKPRRRAGAQRWRRPLGVVLTAIIAVVGIAWLIAARGSQSGSPPQAVPTSSVPVSAGIVIGHVPVRKDQMTYFPGSSRSWQASEGLHQVNVVAGTLSVEDGHGHRRDYGAGETYVAGWSPYVATNRTNETVQVTIEYLREHSAAEPAAPAPDE